MITYREALLTDIPGMQVVRNAVRENRLSDPALVPDSDYVDYMQNRGQAWVCLDDRQVVGFAIVSVTDKNVWALFVDPAYEKKGIGRKLHTLMMDWYFRQTGETIWLSTAPGTRAEQFYTLTGWRVTGMTRGGETRFEMTGEEWEKINAAGTAP